MSTVSYFFDDYMFCTVLGRPVLEASDQPGADKAASLASLGARVFSGHDQKQRGATKLMDVNHSWNSKNLQLQIGICEQRSSRSMVMCCLNEKA